MYASASTLHSPLSELTKYLVRGNFYIRGAKPALSAKMSVRRERTFSSSGAPLRTILFTRWYFRPRVLGPLRMHRCDRGCFNHDIVESNADTIHPLSRHHSSPDSRTRYAEESELLCPSLKVARAPFASPSASWHSVHLCDEKVTVCCKSFVASHLAPSDPKAESVAGFGLREGAER